MTNTDYDRLEEVEIELAIARKRFLDGFFEPPFEPSMQVMEEFDRKSNEYHELIVQDLRRRRQELQRRGDY